MLKNRPFIKDNAHNVAYEFSPLLWHYEMVVEKDFNRLSVESLSDQAEAYSWGIEFEVPNIEGKSFLLMPGAIYNGNRFKAQEMPYSPRLEDKYYGVDCETIISNIKRLNIGKGPSKIDLLTGDLAIPIVAIFNPITQQGVIVSLENPTNEYGDYGIQVEEDELRSKFIIRVATPGVRDKRYAFPEIDPHSLSPDQGKIWSKGETFELKVKTENFACKSVHALYAKVFEMRSLWNPQAPEQLGIFNAAKLVEKHYNCDLWNEQQQLYITGWNFHLYQNGWCGGIIAQYALLAWSDDAQSIARAIQHLDIVFTNSVSPSGLLYGKFMESQGWCSDRTGDQSATTELQRNMTLVRRHGDVLFYGIAAVEAMEKRSITVPNHWREVLKKIAAVFCNIFEKHGQWGQLIDQKSGDIVVGNSASGGIIPAALLKAYNYFDIEMFKDYAIKGGDQLYSNFTAFGVTSGGPGDAMQVPDSESSYALVESYWALYLNTQEQMWLERTQEAVNQFASWVTPYNYPYPTESEFGRLGMLTAGSIFANAQNCHLAPICTHSGRGLFEFAKHINNREYLRLIAQIVRAIPQLVSRKERPIFASNGDVLPEGWINERVNTSDWDSNVGGVFHGFTWCEVSMLLTASEIPGIYYSTKLNELFIFDNIQAFLNDDKITINNRYNFDMNITFQKDTSEFVNIKIDANSTVFFYWNA